MYVCVLCTIFIHHLYTLYNCESVNYPTEEWDFVFLDSSLLCKSAPTTLDPSAHAAFMV